MNWSGFRKERIDLGLPLLLIIGPNGFLGCGYINVDTCNKTGEACAIVSGVNSHEDMLKVRVKAVSNEARKLGVTEEMTGEEALRIFR